jgi:DNA-binding FrmR family transcriptional regulator
MLPENSTAIRVALKKTRGMVEKIDTMLDEDRYCIDIAQQVNAAIGLLRGINRTILVNHLHTCRLARQEKTPGVHRRGTPSDGGDRPQALTPRGDGSV